MGEDARPGPRVALALALLALAPPPAAQDRPAWRGFHLFLWCFDDPAPAEAGRRLAELGITAVNAEAGSPGIWPRAAGLPCYLGHAAGKGFLHLREGPWQALWEEWYRRRDPDLLVRDPCLSDPAARTAAEGRVQAALAGPFAGMALALSLDDEISATRFLNPLDLCRSPHCLAGFQAWLRDRLPKGPGTSGDGLEVLGDRWGIPVPGSWAEVLPATVDGMRRLVGAVPYPAHLSWWDDTLAFRDRLLAQVVEDLLGGVRARRPDLPCGFLGGQAPAPWGGYDWSLLAPLVGFVEAYDLGGARDVVASFVRPGTRRVETLFPEEGREGLARAALYDLLAHGLDGAILWSSRGLLDSGGRPRPAMASLAGACREASGELGRRLAGSAACPGPWEVGIVESQASLRVHWWKDSLGDGPTWPRRFSSYELTHSTAVAARVAWIRLIEDVGMQPRFLAETALAQGALRRWPELKILVLPRVVALGDEACREVEAFVRERGGTVLADGETALYAPGPAGLRRRARGGLDGLFGLERPREVARWRTCDPEGRVEEGARREPAGYPLLQRGLRPEGETPCRRHQAEAWGFAPDRAPGHVRYWNLAIGEYTQWRLKPAEAARALALRIFFGEALSAAGAGPPLGLRATVPYAAGPVPLELLLRRGPGEGRLLVIRVNLREDPERLAELVRRGPLEVHLEAAAPSAWRDLRSGRELARGQSWRLELLPAELLALEELR